MQRNEQAGLRRGMVDVIAKLQEAARKGAEAAERLERGDCAAEAVDEEAEAEEEEAEAEAEAAAEVDETAAAPAAELDTAVPKEEVNGAREAAAAAATAAVPQGQPAPRGAAVPAAINGTSSASGAAAPTNGSVCRAAQDCTGSSCYWENTCPGHPFSAHALDHVSLKASCWGFGTAVGPAIGRASSGPELGCAVMVRLGLFLQLRRWQPSARTSQSLTRSF